MTCYILCNVSVYVSNATPVVVIKKNESMNERMHNYYYYYHEAVTKLQITRRGIPYIVTYGICGSILCSHLARLKLFCCVANTLS